MSNQYNKTPGSALFWGNRTKLPYWPFGNHNYTPRCYSPITNYVYRYKKSDITIQKGWTLNPNGGYVIFSNRCPISYESIEIGTGEVGSGEVGYARIGVSGGTFQNLDKITLGSRTIELRTDGQGGEYYAENNKWNIPSGPLSAQINDIVSKLNNSRSYSYVPDSGKFNYSNPDNVSIYMSSKYLSSTANGVAIGVTSSNPNITITQGLANPVKAKASLQSITFEAIAAGSAGNSYLVGLSTGSLTSTPEISINGNNQIDIKIQSGVTTYNQIVSAVNGASSPVKTFIFASLVLNSNGAISATSPTSQVSLDGGTSHTFTNWTPGDKLKNAFISSPKFMYGYNDTSASSVTINETYIDPNTILYQTYHALQIISHPNNNMGAWFRKNSEKNATAKVDNAGNSALYSYMEFALKGAAAGVAGNQYSFEIRNHPNLGNAYNTSTATNARFRLESNANGANKKVVLILGLENGSPMYTRAVTDYNHLMEAILLGDAGVKDILETNFSIYSTFSISNPQAETFFTGASVAGTSDLIQDGAVDCVWGSVRYSTFPSYNALGELNYDGKSKQADDTGGILKSSGKFGGVFARVVPAGTTFKAYGYIADLSFTAKTGGAAGNNISIKYTSGATAGAEVVTVIGSAITVQVEDTVTTAAQVETAIKASAAASALVSVKIVGTTTNIQSSDMTPTAVPFTGGAAALTKDSGYFITSRRNFTTDTDLVDQNYYRGYEVLFSKDLSNPDSFQHVCWFNQNHLGSIGVRGDRFVTEVFDVIYNNNNVMTPAIMFNLFHPNNGFTSVSSTRTVYPKEAHLYSGNCYFKPTSLMGSDGNRAFRIKIETGATVGSEIATISGKDITLKVSINATTIAQLQAAISANPAVSAAISLTPISVATTDSVVNVSHQLVELNSGVTHWPYEGQWGFGYCNINEISFVEDNSSNNYDSVKRKSPRGWSNEWMIDTFRISKLT